MSYFSQIFTPFCIVDGTSDDVGPGTGYPIGFSRDELQEIIYRSNAFTAEFTAPITVGITSSVSATLSSGSAPESRGVSDELDFSCEIPITSKNSLLQEDDDTSTTYDEFDPGAQRSKTTDSAGAVARAIYALMLPPTGLPLVYEYGGLYYPAMSIQFEIVSGTNRYVELEISEDEGETWEPFMEVTRQGMSRTYVFDPSWDDTARTAAIAALYGPPPYDGTDFFNLQEYSASAVIFGKEITILGYSMDSLDFDLGADAFSNFTENFSASPAFVLSISGWLPYDPGDGGGPVWDATDGSELRDPFSIIKLGDGSFL